MAGAPDDPRRVGSRLGVGSGGYTATCRQALELGVTPT